jgi:hypothetical protein
VAPQRQADKLMESRNESNGKSKRKTDDKIEKKESKT